MGFRKKKNSALTNVNETKELTTVDSGSRLLPERSKKKTSTLPDPYFLKLTKGARILRYVVTLILAVFTVSMAFIYSEEITGEKLKLLLRNASFSLPGEKIAYTTVRYDADPEMDFASYREYFAAATTSCLRLYDHRGNIALDEKISMSDPTIDAGKDYILVYDREGKNYLICNSVTALKSASEDFPISFADVCDNGSYMIVTGSASYLCVIRFYNRSFKQSREMQIDRYPLYAELSDDGTRMMLLTYTTDAEGRFEGHVGFYDLTGETRLQKEIVEDKLPLGGRLFENGAAVLYGDRLVFFDKNGTEKNTAFFEDFEGVSGAKPSHFASGGGCFAVSFSENVVTKKNRILCFDQNDGGCLLDLPFTGQIERMFCANGMLFVSEADATTVYDSANGEKCVLPVSLPEEVFAGVDDTLFFCFRNKAENMQDQRDLKKLRETDRTDRENENGASGENGPESADENTTMAAQPERNETQ